MSQTLRYHIDYSHVPHIYALCPERRGKLTRSDQNSQAGRQSPAKGVDRGDNENKPRTVEFSPRRAGTTGVQSSRYFSYNETG